MAAKAEGKTGGVTAIKMLRLGLQDSPLAKYVNESRAVAMRGRTRHDRDDIIQG